MIDPKFIGHELGWHTVEIEKGRLKLFNKVIGQTNPVYFDDEAAKVAGYPGLPVPPSFYFSLDMEQKAPFSWFEMLGIDIAKVLHGMQGFTYHKPAYAGQVVTLRARITDIYAKKGGALEFVIKEVSVRDDQGELLADLKITLVVRN